MSQHPDFVVCQICGKRFKQITYKHLQKHWPKAQKVTEIYQQKYPDFPITSSNTHQKLKRLGNNWNVGKILTIEHRKHVGEGLEKYYKSEKGKHTKQHFSKLRKGRIAWNKGKQDIFSEEALQKISETSKKQKGKIISIEARKKTAETLRCKYALGLLKPNLEKAHVVWAGQHHTAEACKKISESNRGKNIGEKSARWKGGISRNPYSTRFLIGKIKNDILKRDKYTCQICGKFLQPKSRSSHVHHIDRNKINDDFFNLISLCVNCHIGKAHKLNQEDYWTITLQELQRLQNIHSKHHTA